MLPGFNRILKEGVRAKWMEPLFPTLSYPTWTTLYTGRYAEVHNVVGNFYYDAATGEKFFSPKWDKVNFASYFRVCLYVCLLVLSFCLSLNKAEKKVES